MEIWRKIVNFVACWSSYGLISIVSICCYGRILRPLYVGCYGLRLFFYVARIGKKYGLSSEPPGAWPGKSTENVARFETMWADVTD